MATPAHQKLIDRDREMIPRVLLRAVSVLCLSCLGIATYASLTDRPLSAMPPTIEEAPVVAERVIRIYGRMDGSARVLAEDGTVIANLGPDEGGFVAGMHRVLERERGAVGLDGSAPVRLVRHADGRLSLRDDLTDFRTELTGAFGADNERVFARMLED